MPGAIRRDGDRGRMLGLRFERSLPPRGRPDMSSSPPFRAEHIGSLVRPPELLRAREEHAAGRLDHHGLRAIEDAAIRSVVKLQEGIGLKVVTDGEFRRGTYSDSFTSAGISGVAIKLTEEQ